MQSSIATVCLHRWFKEIPERQDVFFESDLKFDRVNRMITSSDRCIESRRTRGTSMTDWQANDYFHHSALQESMAQEQLSQLHLDGNESVLDVGCGDGKITAQIAGRVPHGSILGIDPSPAMITFATRHFGTIANPNLRFAVADVRHLTYKNQFDLVISFNALHWVPQQQEALRSIHAALKPNGKAQLRLVPEGSRKSLEDVIEQVRSGPRWAPNFVGFEKPFAHFTPAEYRLMAEQAGFRVQKLNVADKSWDFTSRPLFEAFCRATFAEWTQHLPESDWSAFITEVLDRYQTIAAESPQENHTFKFYQMEVELLPVQPELP